MWVIVLVVAAILVSSLVCVLLEAWAAQLVDEDERPIYQRGGTGRPLWRCDHWMHDVERCTPTKHYGRA